MSNAAALLFHLKSLSHSAFSIFTALTTDSRNGYVLFYSFKSSRFDGSAGTEALSGL